MLVTNYLSITLECEWPEHMGLAEVSDDDPTSQTEQSSCTVVYSYRKQLVR